MVRFELSNVFSINYVSCWAFTVIVSMPISSSKSTVIIGKIQEQKKESLTQSLTKNQGQIRLSTKL